MVYYYLIVSKIYINDEYVLLCHYVSFCNLHKYFNHYSKNSTHTIVLIKPIYNGLKFDFYRNIPILRNFS